MYTDFQWIEGYIGIKVRRGYKQATGEGSSDSAWAHLLLPEDLKPIRTARGLGLVKIQTEVTSLIPMVID